MNERALPAPGETELFIDVNDDDGETCRRFTPDGPVEVWIVVTERPVNSVGREGMKLVVSGLAFPNYPVAREHAHAIDTACKLLGTAIAEARTHADDPIPTVDDGHEHVVRFTRYSRTIPVSAECEICMATLVPDVTKWAQDRGIVPLGSAHAHTEVVTRRGTIKDAIEQAFNRAGGLAT